MSGCFKCQMADHWICDCPWVAVLAEAKFSQPCHMCSEDMKGYFIGKRSELGQWQHITCKKAPPTILHRNVLLLLPGTTTSETAIVTKMCPEKPSVALSHVHARAEDTRSASYVNMTEQQRKIVSYIPDKIEKIKIRSGPGTGKTTTLQLLARAILERQPNASILYAPFSKSVQAEARANIDQRVVVRTIHSLAYKHVKELDRDSDLCKTLQPENIIDFLRLREFLRALIPDKFTIPASATSQERVQGEGRQQRLIKKCAKYVIKTYRNFLWSKDEAVSEQHVLFKATADKNLVIDEQRYVKWAQALYTEAKRLSQSDVPIPHDVYVKLFQLSRPDLKFDFVLIDECQDLSECMADVLFGQNCCVYLVGDSNQKIYGWRGAKASFQEFPADKQFALTHSFRFGTEIARVANDLQLFLGCSDEEKLTGENGEGKVLPPGTRIEEDHVVIGRSHKGLFNALVAYAREASRGGRGMPSWAMVGDSANDSSNFMFTTAALAVYNKLFQLVAGGAGCDVTISLEGRNTQFGSWDELEQFVQEELDEDGSACKNIRMQMGAVRDFWMGSNEEDLPEEGEPGAASARASAQFSSFVSTIQKAQCKGSSWRSATVLLTTTHAAKGLEFPCVCLADDFLPFEDKKTGKRRMLNPFTQEEFNCLYVAITRAQQALRLNEELWQYMQQLRQETETETETETDHSGLRCNRAAEVQLARANRAEAEAEWARFELLDRCDRTAANFVWPSGPPENALSLDASMTEGDVKHVRNSALRRWHPDKVLSWLQPAIPSAQRDVVLAKADEVTKLIVVQTSEWVALAGEFPAAQPATAQGTSPSNQAEEKGHEEEHSQEDVDPEKTENREEKKGAPLGAAAAACPASPSRSNRSDQQIQSLLRTPQREGRAPPDPNFTRPEKRQRSGGSHGRGRGRGKGTRPRTLQRTLLPMTSDMSHGGNGREI